MTDADIERLASEYIAADWTPDRYYRDMNLIAFANKLLEHGYAEGRSDQQQEDGELLRWAYSKLHFVSFAKPDDALMLDRFKLLLEHGIAA